MKLHDLAGLGALALATGAQAEAVRATRPQSIVSAMQNAGYKASLDKDSTGDPLINSAASGSNFLRLLGLHQERRLPHHPGLR
ncbi:MAG: hypothetical protein ACOYLK_14540 [Sphingomonas sp.]